MFATEAELAVLYNAEKYGHSTLRGLIAVWTPISTSNTPVEEELFCKVVFLGDMHRSKHFCRLLARG